MYMAKVAPADGDAKPSSQRTYNKKPRLAGAG
jgi:hypothetical protein